MTIHEDIEIGGWDVSSNSESDDESIVGNISSSIRGLDYVGNSCYQDSTLLALLAIPNRFITTNMLIKDLSKDLSKQIDYRLRIAFQKEIVRIAKSMRGLDHVKDCTNLRKLIKYCKGPQPFHEVGTQDAGEFLLYIFDIFNIEDVIIERITLVTNDLTRRVPKEYIETHKVIQNSSPIISIHSGSIFNIAETDLRKFIDRADDTVFELSNVYIHKPTNEVFRRRIELNRIVKADYIIFNVHRLHQLIDGKRIIEKRLYTPIRCPEQMTIRSRILHLHAIVVHEHNHYTCYIKCSGHWYYYNDLASHKISPIGNYKKMLLQKPSAETCGTLYFYS